MHKGEWSLNARDEFVDWERSTASAEVLLENTLNQEASAEIGGRRSWPLIPISVFTKLAR